MLILKGYKHPDDDFDWEDLGINENKLFKDIKEIKGNANFEKLSVTNLGNLQSIGGNANFYNSQITDLGQLKKISGDAWFVGSKVTNLANLQVIGGDNDIRESKLNKSDFKNIEVKWELYH